MANQGLGQVVRQARLACELTQEALAAYLGVPKTWVVDLERGKAKLTDPNMLRRLARALDLRPSDLLEQTIKGSPPLASITDWVPFQNGKGRGILGKIKDDKGVVCSVLVLLTEDE